MACCTVARWMRDPGPRSARRGRRVRTTIADRAPTTSYDGQRFHLACNVPGCEDKSMGGGHAHKQRPTLNRDSPNTASSTVAIGEFSVNRIGYGAMSLTGPGVWGYPADKSEAKRLLRRAVELGVNLIDTADAYGPHVSEEIIAEALHPYRGVYVATKGGMIRPGPNEWLPLGRPEYLRQQVELSLRRLRTDCIDLYQLHRVDRTVPLEESIAELVRLQREGKIKEIGISGIILDQLIDAMTVCDIASVQNSYNMVSRGDDAVLQFCEDQGIAFLAYSPLGNGSLATAYRITRQIKQLTGWMPSQIALSWLLKRSPALLPIPGTTSIGHLEGNMLARSLHLSDELYERLSKVKVGET